MHQRPILRRGFYLFFLSYLFYLPISGFAQDKFTLEESITQFNHLRKDLTTILSAPAARGSGCGVDLPSFSGKECKMQTLCEPFQAEQETGVLYQDARGGKIIDLRLLGIEREMKSCYDQKVASPMAEKTQKAEESKAIQEMRQAKTAYLTSVSKNNQDKIKTALDLAASEMIQDNSLKSPRLSQHPKTLEEIDKDLVEVETLAKVRFSIKTRDLYLKYLVLKGKVGLSQSGSKSAPLNASSQGWKILHHPLLNPKALYEIPAAGSREQLEKNQQEYQKGIRRVYDVFRETQKAVVEWLHSRQTTENHDLIENMVTRVQSVQMNPLTLDSKNEALNGVCKSPNAFYSEGSHKLTICPQYLLYPEMSLRKSIAHELGHSIDPCRLTDPLISVKDTVAKPKPASKKKVESEENAKNYISYKPVLPATPRSIYRVARPGLAEAILKDTYQSYKTEVQADRISFDKNPFLSSLNCLKLKSSVGMRVANSEELENDLDEVIHEYEGRGATAENSPFLRDLYNAKRDVGIFKERIVCKTIPNGLATPQLNETFSDFVASKTLNHYLEKLNPKVRKDKALESVGSFLTSCRSSNNQSFLDKANHFLEDMGCKKSKAEDFFTHDIQLFKTAISQTHDEHPLTVKRVERLFLMEPNFQKALGCTPQKGVERCD